MKIARFILFACLFLIQFESISFAQAGITPTVGWVDPAMNHNRLIREQTGDGVYKLIGTFKVIGTSYLFGERNKGNLYSAEAKAYNISISYNTYNQEVEFYSAANTDKPLIKEPGTVDSFIINENISLGILSPLKFVYGATIGSNDKFYFQELFSGKKYNLYKRYKSDLGYVSTNYIQSELRQFDLLFDYYYTDNDGKTIKKLKSNISNIIKEFKSIKDISSVLTSDAFALNQDGALRKAFEYLNN